MFSPQNLFINAPHLCQIAAAAALDPECEATFEGNVAMYRRNREILMTGLPKAGFTKLSSAGGAYYIYADVSDITADSIGNKFIFIFVWAIRLTRVFC